MTDYFISFRRWEIYKGKENIDIGFWSADMRVYLPTFLGISFDVLVLHEKKMAYVFSDSLTRCIHLRFSYYQCNKSHPSMRISTRIYIYTFETRLWNLSISNTYRVRHFIHIIITQSYQWRLVESLARMAY